MSKRFYRWDHRLLIVVVVVLVFFTLIDRASTVPSNIRGCQSGTLSAGQENIKGTSTKKSSNESMKTKATKDRNKKHKCILSCQKKLEGHSIERVWYSIVPAASLETVVRTQRHRWHRLDADKFPMFSVGWRWQGFCRDLDRCWFE